MPYRFRTSQKWSAVHWRYVSGVTSRYSLWLWLKSYRSSIQQYILILKNGVSWMMMTRKRKRESSTSSRALHCAFIRFFSWFNTSVWVCGNEISKFPVLIVRFLWSTVHNLGAIQGQIWMCHSSTVFLSLIIFKLQKMFMIPFKKKGIKHPHARARAACSGKKQKKGEWEWMNLSETSVGSWVHVGNGHERDYTLSPERQLGTFSGRAVALTMHLSNRLFTTLILNISRL